MLKATHINNFLIEAGDAATLIEQNSPLIIDLGKAETYQQHHLPGAINLNYEHLVHGMLPAPGGLPATHRLQALFDAIGLTPTTHVLVYDDEGNGKASRFIWILDIIGHAHYSMLNGGIHSWVNEGHLISREAHRPQPAQAVLAFSDTPRADKHYVLNVLESDDHILLDTRSEAEFSGQRGGGLRQGHIPGAIHFNWLEAIDRQNNLKLYPAETLQAKFDALGLSKDREIIIYCATMYRASHTYAVLKYLGYPRIKGYAGSWSEWGNDPELPIA